MTGLQRYNILLIEDDSVQAELVSRHLDSGDPHAHGVTFDVTWVTYLRDGIERLADNDFDAVLLDLRLPDCQGLESIHRLLAQDSDASIIVLTGVDDADVAVQAAREGAQDYLKKSDLTPEHLIRSLRYAVEHRERRLTQRRLDATQREMKSAGEVQRMLLPTSAPIVPGLEIAGSYWPFDHVGGDYYDYFSADGRLSLVIADVSGHGLASALVMAGLRRLLRSCVEMHDDVGEILSIVNRAVFEDTVGGRFVTAFFGSVDIETRELTYASAGHPSYIVTPSGDATRLNSGNIPLGLLREEVMTSRPPVVLQPGEVLVLLTDGLYEAQNSNGELWGVDALLQTIHQHRNQTADGIIAAVHAGVHAHCDPNPVNDDMALIVVKVAE
jgi:serine phosphatase RsbU (regulator of sigma subunit)